MFVEPSLQDLPACQLVLCSSIKVLLCQRKNMILLPHPDHHPRSKRHETSDSLLKRKACFLKMNKWWPKRTCIHVGNSSSCSLLVSFEKASREISPLLEGLLLTSHPFPCSSFASSAVTCVSLEYGSAKKENGQTFFFLVAPQSDDLWVWEYHYFQSFKNMKLIWKDKLDVIQDFCVSSRPFDFLFFESQAPML